MASAMVAKFSGFFLYIFAFISYSICDEWNHADYLKKEHSLVRPYQGKVYFLALLSLKAGVFSLYCFCYDTARLFYGFDEFAALLINNCSYMCVVLVICFIFHQVSNKIVSELVIDKCAYIFNYCFLTVIAAFLLLMFYIYQQSCT